MCYVILSAGYVHPVAVLQALFVRNKFMQVCAGFIDILLILRPFPVSYINFEGFKSFFQQFVSIL